MEGPLPEQRPLEDARASRRVLQEGGSELLSRYDVDSERGQEPQGAVQPSSRRFGRKPFMVRTFVAPAWSSKHETLTCLERRDVSREENIRFRPLWRVLKV